tara:strand:- start:1619 stop:2053 length:435 start_codon:yes stop_codon:yes gene_type:complete
MKNTSFVKKIKKRIPGVEIHVAENQWRDRCWFQHGNQVCSWYVEKDGTARNFHRRREDDHSDMMTDYFAGCFYDNGTQLLNSVAPPPPKFSEGDLVRCKDNKRMNRWSLAGQLAIVKQANPLRLEMMNGKNHDYLSERDLELAS